MPLQKTKHMSLSVEQLVCRSFPDSENTVYASENLPPSVQQSFLQLVVDPYWQNQSVPGKILRAAYLQQIQLSQTLFGWLYHDTSASDSKDWTVDFICYYTSQKLDGSLLDGIFNCLEHGPASRFEDLKSDDVQAIELPLEADYAAAESGTEIPSGIRARTRLLLYQEKPLHFFIPVESTQETELLNPALAESLNLSLPTNLTLPLTLAPETALGQTLQNNLVEPQNELQFDLGESFEVSSENNIPLEGIPFTPLQKVALLIGVSDCELGFKPLPGAEKDVESLQAALCAAEIGGFNAVKTLINPSSQEMAEEIELFLSNCPENCLALLYFSGHGVWDSQGSLCLSTKSSRRNLRKILRSTFISADFLSAVLQDSAAAHPVLILDCCLAEDDLISESSRRDRLSQFKQQFAQIGTTVLASSTAVHPTGVQKGHRASLYTSYLVEGLGTGIADLDEDGTITLEEWHRYAKQKAQLSSPAMHPLLCGPLTQGPLEIAQNAVGDPRLHYRREVERSIENGKISLVNQLILDKTQKSLDLPLTDCVKIKSEVLKPHQDYQQKLRQYASAFLSQIQQSEPTRTADSRTLCLQDSLGLTDADTVPIQNEIFHQLAAIQSHAPKALASPGGAITLTNVNRSYARPAFLQQLSNQGAAFQASLANLLALIERKTEGLIHRVRRSIPGQTQSNFDRQSSLNESPLLPSGLTPVTILLGCSGALLLLTAAIFNARQQQNQERSLTQLDSLFRKRAYDQCISQAQDLDRQGGTAAAVQKLLGRCQAGAAWKNASATTLGQPLGTVQSIAFGLGDSVLASGGDSSIQIWDLSKQTLLRNLKNPGEKVWSLAASPDGKLLASGGGDKSVRLWQFSTGKLLRTLQGHQGTVWATAFIPSHPLVASGSEDGTVRLWDTATGKLVRSLKTDKSPIRALATSLDGKIIMSGGANKTIAFWNVDSGSLIRTLKGHTDRVLALSAQGSELASISSDQTVRVWSIDKGDLLQTIKTEQKAGRALALSSLAQLASSAGTTLKLTDADTGRLLNEFSGSANEVSAAAFGADGKVMAIARQDKNISILRR